MGRVLLTLDSCASRIQILRYWPGVGRSRRAKTRRSTSALLKPLNFATFFKTSCRRLKPTRAAQRGGSSQTIVKSVDYAASFFRNAPMAPIIPLANSNRLPGSGVG